MCGITGFIGKSTNPDVSYALITSLLIKTEPRGDQATGFWAAQEGKNGLIMYHKEPIKSSEFVKKDMWKLLKDFNPNIMLAHCREPTPTVGSPKWNKNNHPFVSGDVCTALVHNGKISEYHSIKHKYSSRIKSQCDSELLLRLFETGKLYANDIEFLKKKFPTSEKFPEFDPEISYKLQGLSEVFLNIHEGAMAVAIGERHHGTNNENARSLWLFRNEQRPLHMINMRDTLGQIFFCSTPEIWKEAVQSCPEARDLIPLKHSVVVFPSMHIYLIRIKQDGQWSIKIYKIFKEEIKDNDDPRIIVPTNVSTFAEIDNFNSDVKVVSILDKEGEPTLKLSEVLRDTFNLDSNVDDLVSFEEATDSSNGTTEDDSDHVLVVESDTFDDPPIDTEPAEALNTTTSVVDNDVVKVSGVSSPVEDQKKSTSTSTLTTSTALNSTTSGSLTIEASSISCDNSTEKKKSSKITKASNVLFGEDPKLNIRNKLEKINEELDGIEEVVSDIRTSLRNMYQENSVQESMLLMLCEEIETKRKELRSIQYIRINS